MRATDPTEDSWLLNRVVKANQFQTTHWTTVLSAGRQSSCDSEAALAKLCQIYWGPVHAYIRKRTPSLEQAQDLTQSFFERLLEKNYVGRAEPERGRFRSFLMTCVENFLCDQHDRAATLKRGGGQSPLSLDVRLQEDVDEPAEALTPALAFEKRWVRSLLDEVMRRLTEEYESSGRSVLLQLLHSHLSGDTDCIPYDELSKQLGMTSINLRVSAHRARQRYREILHEEIAHTVASPDEIESEIRYLLQVLGS